MSKYVGIGTHLFQHYIHELLSRKTAAPEARYFNMRGCFYGPPLNVHLVILNVVEIFISHGYSVEPSKHQES